MVVMSPKVKYWAIRIGGLIALVLVLLVGLTPLIFVFRPIDPAKRQPALAVNLDDTQQSAILELRLLLAQPDFLFLPLVANKDDFVVMQRRITHWQHHHLNAHLDKVGQKARLPDGEINGVWVFAQVHGLGWAYECVVPQEKAHIQAIRAEVHRMVRDFYGSSEKAQQALEQGRQLAQDLVNRSDCMSI
jgi:hypothetical protein